MNPHLLHFLEGDQAQNLHQNALVLLERMGAVVDHEGALRACEDAGARVDFQKRVVSFPPQLLAEVIGRTPGRFLMAARVPERDTVMGGDALLSRPVMGCISFTDTHDNYHPATTTEAVSFARLVDGVDEYSWNAAMVYPADQDPATRDLTYCSLLFQNTSKHFAVSSYSPAAFRVMVEMGVAVAGSAQALRERPLFHTVVSPSSPLTYTRHHVEWIDDAGKAGIPIGIASVPVMGATGPATLAGCTVLIHAEIMAGVALAQMLNPGAPVYYAPRPSIMDMRSGNSIWGPIEMGMIDAMCAQLARICGLPCDVLSLRTDSKVMDEQAAHERTANTVMAALAGASSISGGGLLETLRTASMEQVMIDAEILTLVRRARAGVALDADHLALDLMLSLGHDGGYLGQQHTRRHHRSEICFPELSDRATRLAWESGGSKDINQRARERVQQVLREHAPVALDAAVAAELHALLESGQRVLAHAQGVI